MALNIVKERQKEKKEGIKLETYYLIEQKCRTYRIKKRNVFSHNATWHH